MSINDNYDAIEQDIQVASTGRENCFGLRSKLIIYTYFSNICATNMVAFLEKLQIRYRIQNELVRNLLSEFFGTALLLVCAYYLQYS